ncbi:MAG TPA: cation-translocating P-type ATPase [Anaerolineales bacterium]|nr:cation-translocating P-type ATPase [Anaerolineales bacterium]
MLIIGKVEVEYEITEVPIQGMDCADCTRHVQHALARLPGVESVDVLLGAEKAIIRHETGDLDLAAIRKAVAEAGYAVPAETLPKDSPTQSPGFSRQFLILLGLLFGVVLFAAVIGEGLGLFDALTARLPWPVGLAIVLAIGYPVFRNVFKATLRGQVIAHSLMTLGVLAALVVGEWATAAVVAFFMRVGDYVERFTAERARQAVKDLNRLAPQTARVIRRGEEVVVPIAQVQVGETVVVRPGEIIPVDGEVVAGVATIDQSNITGESMPFEAGPGARVFAATLTSLGSLRVRATQVAANTTFGRVVRLVEEAEANRGEVQRLADRFSAYYLPIVAGIALLTYLISRDPLASVAVLVVACSCSFALATPIAILASVGAGARQGLLIKGGKYLEILAKADVLLIDKTGTLTLGKPRVTDVVTLESLLPANGLPTPEAYLLQLAASAERYSEHPLAEAVRAAASAQGIPLLEPQAFEALPGMGVRARVNGSQVMVGRRNWIVSHPEHSKTGIYSKTEDLQARGKTLLFISSDEQPVGVIAVEDTLREEVPGAIRETQAMGLRQIELLTGDNPRSAAALAGLLGIPYRADLLPEDKIAIVKEYQARGHTVVMVGDGVNDAPALAQADVGIAMGAAGSGIAIEAAHIALLRDDWRLVPQALRIARRTLGVVKMNIGFTGLYNVVGISLAAMGLLPPGLAAAAQSLPDLGILVNSSRLLRQK